MHQPTMSPDEALLRAVLEVARDKRFQRRWDEIEPALAAAWERMRSPACPRWCDMAARVRQVCEAECAIDG
jgi:hypothetical protein